MLGGKIGVDCENLTAQILVTLLWKQYMFLDVSAGDTMVTIRLKIVNCKWWC
jgi:hypothetical protein